MEKRISGHTKLYGLIGSPVGHSGSPAMYNYSFARTGVDAAYLAFDIPLDQLESGVNALKTLGVAGFNVTMPDKTAITGLLDEISPAAKLIGACNTVTVDENGKLTGHNTDGIGFIRNLSEHGVTVEGKRIVLLGAGGAATAIAVQAALDGAAELSIFNGADGFYANAELTVKKLEEAVPGCKTSIARLDDEKALETAVSACDILINATRVGMKPLDGESLIPARLLRKEMAVADTVYNPKKTKLILDAEQAGCRAAVGGSGMLLWQGVEAFRLFTGKEMPAQEVLEQFFA